MEFVSGYTAEEVTELENILLKYGIKCTYDTADCTFCSHIDKCNEVFSEFNKERMHEKEMNNR